MWMQARSCSIVLNGIFLCPFILNPLAFAQFAPNENPPEISLGISQESERDSGLNIAAEPTLEWIYHKTSDGSHPDGNEQEMLWLTNRARSNPTAEGIFLSNTGDPSVKNAIRYFGVDLEVLRDEFSETHPRQPAAFDRHIYLGSLAHSLDLIERDAQDHNDQFNKVKDAGFSYNSAGASVFSFTKSALYGHAGFNIDWGGDGGSGDGMQPGRGHRRSLINSGNSPLTNIGICMAPETDTMTRVGPLVTSITYARADTRKTDHYNKFLVGTVWTDQNSNGRYDSGEGLNEVTVKPNEGVYFAVTGNAGGYAIPIQNDGMYSISFSGGELEFPQQREANVTRQSVLVVWNPQDNYNLSAEHREIEVPNLEISVHNLSIITTWAADPDSNYTLQRSLNVGSWENDNRFIETEGETKKFSVSSDELQKCALSGFRSAHSAGNPIPR